MSEETTETPKAGDSATPKKRPATKKPAATKPAAKKAAPKKPAAAKPAAKKTVAPKAAPAARKPASSKASAAKSTAKAAAEPAASSAAVKSSPSAAPQPEQPKASSQENDSGAASNDNASGDPYAADNLAEALSQKDWKEILVRGAFMLFYGFTAWVSLMLGFSLAVIQFLILIVNGSPNDVVRGFIVGIGNYISEVMDFLSFKSDERPFPFGKDLPGGN